MEINHYKMFTVQNSLLIPARQIPSPNYNERPPGTVIDLIVLHNISLPPGQFGGPYIDALFTNTLSPSIHPSFADLAGIEVSAHLLLDRQGKVTQYVPFNKRAWHAGQSVFQGRKNCNDFSIGIELEGYDTLAYSDAQYTYLPQIINALRIAYPAISLQRITGHSHIAPGRKTDPGGAFDWPRLLAKL